MKGYIYYASEDAMRNAKFIKELVEEAQKLEIDLELLVDDAKPINHASFIIFRGRDYTRAQQFEEEGFRVFNGSETNRIANNKLSTFELAVMLGVPTVETHKLYTPKQIDQYPVIVKTAHGYGGKEVYLCKDIDKVERLQKKHEGDLLVVQPYIEANATDIRVFVMGDEIIGAVKRMGVKDFKSNYTLGGKIEKFKVSKKIELIVEKITDALESDYIGIDFLLRPNGQVLLNEIEDPVGARSLYATHGVSAAEKLMAYVKEAMA